MGYCDRDGIDPATPGVYDATSVTAIINHWLLCHIVTFCDLSHWRCSSDDTGWLYGSVFYSCEPPELPLYCCLLGNLCQMLQLDARNIQFIRVETFTCLILKMVNSGRLVHLVFQAVVREFDPGLLSLRSCADIRFDYHNCLTYSYISPFCR